MVRPQAGPTSMPVVRFSIPRLRSVSGPPRPVAGAAVEVEAEEELVEEQVLRISVSLEPHTLHLASPRGALPSVHINHVRNTI